jgi:ribosomal protein L37E
MRRRSPNLQEMMESQYGGYVLSIGSGSTTTGKADLYFEVICYNCGEPSHHKTACSLPKSCFICGSLEHEVDAYPVKKQPQYLAKFIGSDASCLGFYHIELPYWTSATLVPVHNNISLFYIDHG